MIVNIKPEKLKYSYRKKGNHSGSAKDCIPQYIKRFGACHHLTTVINQPKKRLTIVINLIHLLTIDYKNEYKFNV